MKFRSLVHTYMSHRRHLKVQASPSPSPRSQAYESRTGSSRDGEEALSS